MATKQYAVILTIQPKGGFVVSVPELPGVVNEGERSPRRWRWPKMQSMATSPPCASADGSYRQYVVSGRHRWVSDKLPAVRPQQVVRALERAGWQRERTRGSHHYLIHRVKREALANARA
jgi:HicA toxin of bacterial toxin-antitoxin,